MAKKTNSRANTVKITGYLKENNLEKITTDKGDAIRGSIIVATGTKSSYKVQYYVSEFTKLGDPSKDFADISELLPAKTVTVAGYLKEHSEAGVDEALSNATKVWTISRFDEYATKQGERENSYVSNKGYKIGFPKEDSFTPKAEFEVDICIGNIEKELDEEENETGRLIIEGLIPKYDDSIDKVTFIAPVEDNVAKYIETKCKVGDTVFFSGDMVSIAERVQKEVEDEGVYFGKSKGPQFETKFIRERLITGGKEPYKPDDEKSVSKDYIKAALALRETKMQKNGEKAANKAKEAPAPAQPATFTFSNSDVDF